MGVLGASAAVMSIRDMQHTLKFLWTVVIFALLIVELRAIDKDRTQYANEQAQIRKEERNSFSAIADGIRTAIQNSQNQFQATTDRSNKILDQTANTARLSTESIKTMTGGDSFCYLDLVSVTATGGIPTIIQKGRYPLYDVTARIVDIAAIDKAGREHPGNIQMQVEIGYRLILHPGSIARGSAWFSPREYVRFTDAKRPDFNVFFSARNGLWHEVLRIRQVNGQWLEVLSVFRTDGLRDTLIYASPIPKDFPNEAVPGLK